MGSRYSSNSSGLLGRGRNNIGGQGDWSTSSTTSKDMERKDLIHYTYEEYKKGSFTTGNIQLNIRLRQRRKLRKIVKTVKWKYSISHKISLGMSHERKKHKGKNKEQVQVFNPLPKHQTGFLYMLS